MDILRTLEEDWEITVIVLLIVVCAFLLSTLVRWLIDKSVLSNKLNLEVDKTRYKFFKNAASFIIWLIAFGTIVSLIPELKALSVTLFAGAGILVAILGLAAQQAFSNIISGIFIVMFKPFRVGDMIKVGDQDYGIVEDITLRHTVLINFENKRIIIPNSVVSDQTITNDTIGDMFICRWVDVGISYDSDIKLATRILQEEAINHPQSIDRRNEQEIEAGEHPIQVRLMGFGDSSLNLRAFVWTDDPLRARVMHSDINIAVKTRFDAEGVEIPFPYRTVVYKNDLPQNAKL